MSCPRCFYIDRRLGIGRPSMPGFTLNTAVDELYKKEFDEHRRAGTPHPIMTEHGIEAVPYDHHMMNEWRENFKGVQVHHQPTNLIITGAVDDIWIDAHKHLIVVDYKATSTTAEITLDSEYRQAYKRQMEIYQWLMRKSGFTVSDMSYFVYANGDKSKPNFNKKLEFNVQLIPYKGNDDWVEKTIVKAKECLMHQELPAPNPHCEYCLYRTAAQEEEVIKPASPKNESNTLF